MFKLGVLLLICGALGQHHVTQQVQPASERQIRLEDIERDGLKSAAASQAAAAVPTTYQQPQTLHSFQQSPAAAYPQPQLQAATAYQPPAAPHPQQPFYQLTPSAFHQPQLSYSPQLLGGHPQQLLQPLLLPQAHPYNVPIMLIPYPLQQEVALLPKVRPLLPQSQPQPQVLTKFRPSPQVQYTNPYSNQVYQQKFGTGVKSTPAPTLKETYDQQQQQQHQSSYNYKLQ